jgi:hypothetical protein
MRYQIPEPHLRYLVFCSDQYYPLGGLDDLEDCFDTIEEAKKFITGLENRYDYVQIYDRIEGREVW